MLAALCSMVLLEIANLTQLLACISALIVADGGRPAGAVVMPLTKLYWLRLKDCD